MRESFITRKELGISLKVRHESFVGVGNLPAFSKIKTQPNSQTRVGSQAKKNRFDYKKLLTNKKALRYALHFALLVVIVSFGFSTRIQKEITHAQGGGKNLSRSGVGAAGDDQSSVLTTGAVLAESTDSLIAPQVREMATAASAQNSLTTSGDYLLAKTQPVSTAGTPARDITSYRVNNGDTLSGLSAKFSITSDTIKWANNIENEDAIKPGQELTILPINGILYTATGNETLEELASRYKSNSNMIDSYNNLEGKRLSAGVKVIIPDGVKEEAPKPAADPAPTSRLASVSRGSSSSVSFRAGSYANGYAYGYCTYYVATRRSVPSNWGNANAWFYNAQASGYAVGFSPQPGAVAQTSGGYGGYGHVAFVESVSGDMVTVSEMNYAGWNQVSSRTVPASSFRYIY